MLVIPAIDILDGKCVRLRQGDYDQETVYGADPLAMAQRWIDAGAAWLHVVDLGGARAGRRFHRQAIRDVAALAARSDAGCQLGGGIRDDDAIREALDLGLDRLVIGTSALERQDWFAAAAERHPGRLLLGLDARQGMVAIRGWTEVSTWTALDLARRFATLPLAGIVYTDVARDGMLAGPNVEATRALAEAVALPVIASGGVASLADLHALAALKLAGCIVGRALYEGAIDPRQAFSLSRGAAFRAATTTSDSRG